ncbi:MAG: ribonuclease HI family protein [Candidatus ainarchaeum sp.]|nr:ribonuclease HI family protein [Candidatus ainarchaeum sp.]MDD5096024.1 ribonuclease HI family protein [Candidatus ainarchaeum sp.]
MIAYTDGCCLGNPGRMGAGVVVLKDGKVLKEISKYLGMGTNNVAEYTAVLLAVEEAKRLGAKGLSVRSDSKLLVNQLCGEFRVKAPHLREIMGKIWKAGEGMTLHFEWIPREQNERADELSKEGAGKG